MPHHTTTLAILATVVVLLFTYQYISTTSFVDLQDYIPASPNSAKFGVDGISDGLSSNIQDAEDLDWDHLPEVEAELMTGPGSHAPIDTVVKRKVNVELGVMSRCPDAVSDLSQNAHAPALYCRKTLIGCLDFLIREFVNPQWIRYAPIGSCQVKSNTDAAVLRCFPTLVLGKKSTSL